MFPAYAYVSCIRLRLVYFPFPVSVRFVRCDILRQNPYMLAVCRAAYRFHSVFRGSASYRLCSQVLHVHLDSKIELGNTKTRIADSPQNLFIIHRAGGVFALFCFPLLSFSLNNRNLTYVIPLKQLRMDVIRVIMIWCPKKDLFLTCKDSRGGCPGNRVRAEKICRAERNEL